MEFIRMLILLLLAFSLFMLIAGIFKPTFAVWWEDVQNRRRVFKIYGKAVLLLTLIYIIIYILIN